ncbi:hypothetical protein C2W62_19745 [Candidatus Entotheonella serta]|nr:hypothetical protein C2W62_19745 [Candidatus Entotheonella serta]
MDCVGHGQRDYNPVERRSQAAWAAAPRVIPDVVTVPRHLHSEVVETHAHSSQLHQNLTINLQNLNMTSIPFSHSTIGRRQPSIAIAYELEKPKIPWLME